MVESKTRDSSTEFSALDAVTGGLLWRRSFTWYVKGSGGIHSPGRSSMTPSTGKTYPRPFVLDARTGVTIDWPSAPNAAETTELVMARTPWDGLIAVDGSSGKKLWANAEGHLLRRFGFVDDVLIVEHSYSKWSLPADGADFYAFARQSGELLWHSSSDVQKLCLAHGHAFVARWGRVVALDIQTGEKRWSVDLPERGVREEGYWEGDDLMTSLSVLDDVVTVATRSAVYAYRHPFAGSSGSN